MDYANFFTEDNIALTEETFHDRERLDFANKALEENPNNDSIKSYRYKLLKKLEVEREERELKKDAEYFVEHGRL